MEIVNVVIPTLGKRGPELARAVDSALNQDGDFHVRVTVVFDGDEVPDELASDLAQKQDLTVVSNPSRRLAARTVGARLGTADYVAFLDDDDYWFPDKLAVQVARARMLRERGHVPIISSRVDQFVLKNSQTINNVPDTAITPSDRVEDYLFRKRSPSVRRNSLFTSTLLVDGNLARAVDWRRIPRHQDWDWLLRAQDEKRAVVSQVEESLVMIQVGSESSISASSDWRASAEWADTALKALAPGILSDFYAAQVLRYALADRSLLGLKVAARGIRRSGALPSFSAVLVGLSGAVPRGVAERIFGRLGRS
ncbi:putative glycosyltransferase [Gordonia namibiensis NBRC 108229]|uniref:Putative glycosyltransferase n=2 Tax=Gordonia namibiensis TaxID=168480 RepID=K6VRN4_9ACTN|nr:glycosyltransferase family 2 protein [Gordonia namibiensis]GAB98863.1 putative glycosyltransferase [Gordonia namibiensis NBRC 108229]